jgi:hypothetical protein
MATTTKRYKTTIKTGERGRVFLDVPFDPHEVWGKKAHHYVKGTMNAHPFEGSLGTRNGIVFMPLSKEFRKEAGIEPGDEVAVVIEPSVSASADLPADLAKALAGAAEAKAFFDTLSGFYQREYVKWIEGAAKAETREARVAEAVKLLKQHVKQRGR